MRSLASLLTFLGLLMLLVDVARSAPNSGGPGMRKGQRGAQAGQIRCGITGCFEIPRGCRGEMRHSGTGQVVVMHCLEHRPQGSNLH